MPARFPDLTVTAQNVDPEDPMELDEDERDCKLLVAKPGRQIWTVGKDMILKCVKHYPGCEIVVENTKMVRNTTSIPIPEIHHSWVDKSEYFGDTYYILQDQIYGATLEEIKYDLTEEELARIGMQIDEFVSQLRGLYNPIMQMLDGRKSIDRRLLKPLSANLQHREPEMIVSDEQLRDALLLRIANPCDVERGLITDFMDKMPKAYPFVFSHSDLHEGNIIIKDGNFVGLIDWELAGFYPWWWEQVNCCEFLDPYLPEEFCHPLALKWFRVYHALREWPNEIVTYTMLTKYLDEYVRPETPSPTASFLKSLKD